MGRRHQGLPSGHLPLPTGRGRSLDVAQGRRTAEPQRLRRLLRQRRPQGSHHRRRRRRGQAPRRRLEGRRGGTVRAIRGSAPRAARLRRFRRSERRPRAAGRQSFARRHRRARHAREPASGQTSGRLAPLRRRGLAGADPAAVRGGGDDFAMGRRLRAFRARRQAGAGLPKRSPSCEQPAAGRRLPWTAVPVGGARRPGRGVRRGPLLRGWR
ncbi:hypothetical protein EMGBS10_00780 [Opitutia bacterium]|nr:hypothetical protein EMGBS10_00780 [Opitutae bacterium]